ncbi:MAG: hypothetical protein MUF28_08230, partial [Ignavibacterium sp.]|nr:hypothetical protein [Ignavibacterium sp.]
MKSFLLSVLIISLMTISNLYSQDIKAKLKGHQAVNGFTVVDDNHKVLFRVTGEGNVGINTPDPNGIFDIQGGTSTTGDGRGINIMAEAGSLEGGNAGGNIMIKSGASSGWDGDPALIFLSGGKNTGVGGSINIYSGHGGDYGGDINIMSSVSHLFHEGANNILSKTTNVLSE